MRKLETGIIGMKVLGLLDLNAISGRGRSRKHPQIKIGHTANLRYELERRGWSSKQLATFYRENVLPQAWATFPLMDRDKLNYRSQIPVNIADKLIHDLANNPKDVKLYWYAHALGDYMPGFTVHRVDKQTYKEPVRIELSLCLLDEMDDL